MCHVGAEWPAFATSLATRPCVQTTVAPNHVKTCTVFRARRRSDIVRRYRGYNTHYTGNFE